MTHLYFILVAFLLQINYLHGIRVTEDSSQPLSDADPADNLSNSNDLILIPYPQGGKIFQHLDSYQIDGWTLLRQISLDGIIRALANVPELEQLIGLLDNITVGDVYGTVFPRGILYAINERILRPLGLTKWSLPSEDDDDDDDGQLAGNVFDIVLQGGDASGDDLDEGSGDDYALDQTLNGPAVAAAAATTVVTDDHKNKPIYVDASVLIKQWLNRLLNIPNV